jgi:esterase/lipase
VAMAAPLELDEPALPYARYLKWVRRYVSKDEDDQRLEERVRALQAERDEPVTGKSHYRKFPVASLAELYDLQQITIQRLPRLTAPLLLAYSDNDQTVPIRNLERIAAAVGTPQADLHQLHLTQSDHILPMDVEMEVVFAAAADFVARYAGDGGPG